MKWKPLHDAYGNRIYTVAKGREKGIQSLYNPYMIYSLFASVPWRPELEAVANQKARLGKCPRGGQGWAGTGFRV